MVFTESQLSYNFNGYNVLDEAFAIMDEAVYLTEEESLLSPVAVPIVENSRIGMPIVNFADVERISEENGISYNEAVESIAYANDLDDIAVAVPDYKLIIDPNIINEMNNVVLTPLPENDIVGSFTEECLDCWVESGDVNYLLPLLEISEKFAGKVLNKRLDSNRRGKQFYELHVAQNGPDNAPTWNQLTSEQRRFYISQVDPSFSTGPSKKKRDRRMDFLIGKYGIKDHQFRGSMDAKGLKQYFKNRNDELHKRHDEEELKRNMNNFFKNGAAANAAAASAAAANAGGGNAADADGNKKVEETKSWLEKIKQTCYNKPKDFIARQIKKIRDWAHRIQNSTETGIWMKIKKVIAKVITTLEGWLTKAPEKAGNDAADNSSADTAEA